MREKIRKVEPITPSNHTRKIKREDTFYRFLRQALKKYQLENQEKDSEEKHPTEPKRYI